MPCKTNTEGTLFSKITIELLCWQQDVQVIVITSPQTSQIYSCNELCLQIKNKGEEQQ